jgi:hypothetical protein
LRLLESELAARAAGSTEQITENMVMAKRDIFGELVEDVAATKSCHREKKLTLRSYKVDAEPAAEGRFQAPAKPNPQAAALVLLVRKYPDTLLEAGRSGRWLVSESP